MRQDLNKAVSKVNDSNKFSKINPVLDKRHSMADDALLFKTLDPESKTNMSCSRVDRQMIKNR